MQTQRSMKKRSAHYCKGASVTAAALSIFTFACGAPPPPPVSPEPPPPEAPPAPPPKAAQPKVVAADSIEGAAALAKWVVIGKVGKKESKWIGGKIATTAVIQPISVLKGQGAPSPLTILFLGGAVGPIRQDFSGETVAVEGETAVFFLTDPQAGSGPGLSELPRIARKIPLLAPGEADSRLKNNRRLVRFQNEIAQKVKKGAE